MKHFGGIAEEYRNYSSSDIVIIPVPYDKTSTWIKGADKGPDAVIEASENMELYDIETDSEIYLRGIHTIEVIQETEGPEKLALKVKEKVSGILNDQKFPVIVGGEHSVSIGAFQAVSEHYSDLSILQIDAHADLRESYKGSSYNHACVMARARELAPIVQVGIRSISAEEKNLMDEERVFFAHEIKHSLHWMDEASSLLNPNVYITIDLDAFDPSFVPATGTPEPGGFDYYSVLNFMKKVNGKFNIVGFDVVELCPIAGQKASDFFAAKLIYQLLSLKFG